MSCIALLFHIVRLIPGRPIAIKRLQLRIPIKQDITLEEPWKPSACVVRNVPPGWHTENIIKLFQCALSVLFRKNASSQQTKLDSFFQSFDMCVRGPGTHLVSGTMKKMTTQARMFSPA